MEKGQPQKKKEPRAGGGQEPRVFPRKKMRRGGEITDEFEKKKGTAILSLETGRKERLAGVFR